MRKLLTFLSNIINAALNKIKKMLVRVIKNAPAIGTLVLAACGTAGLLSQLPIEAMFVSMWYISETMIVPLLSIGIVYSLAWLAGRTYDVGGLQQSYR